MEERWGGGGLSSDNKRCGLDPSLTLENTSRVYCGEDDGRRAVVDPDKNTSN